METWRMNGCGGLCGWAVCVAKPFTHADAPQNHPTQPSLSAKPAQLPQTVKAAILLFKEDEYMKQTDEKCLNCTYYDICQRGNSQDCDNYYYYKCEKCPFRISGEARCYRGQYCSQVTLCTIGGR